MAEKTQGGKQTTRRWKKKERDAGRRESGKKKARLTRWRRGLLGGKLAKLSFPFGNNFCCILCRGGTEQSKYLLHKVPAGNPSTARWTAKLSENLVDGNRAITYAKSIEKQNFQKNRKKSTTPSFDNERDRGKGPTETRSN